MSASPRSSILGRGSAKRTRGGDSMHLVSRLEENLLPVLVAAAVVVAAVIAFIIGDDYQSVTTQLSWPELLQNPALAGAVLAGVLVCTAWVTAHAYMHSDQMYRWILLGIFVGAAVVLGIALWLFFCRPDDRLVAFWLVVLVAVGLVVHTWVCYRALHFMGILGMVPVLVVGVLLLWYFWQDRESAGARRA